MHYCRCGCWCISLSQLLLLDLISVVLWLIFCQCVVFCSLLSSEGFPRIFVTFCLGDLRYVFGCVVCLCGGLFRNVSTARHVVRINEFGFAQWLKQFKSINVFLYEKLNYSKTKWHYSNLFRSNNRQFKVEYKMDNLGGTPSAGSTQQFCLRWHNHQVRKIKE